MNSTRAAIIAALFACMGTPAGAQLPPAAGSPSTPAAPTGTLPGGVAYELRPDPGQSAAAIALWYRAPSGGFSSPAIPGLSRLAAATVAASTPITGTPLSVLVSRAGGRLSVEAYADSVAITAVVPPDRAAATLRAMTGDYFTPVVTETGLQAGLADSSDDALLRSFGPDAIEDALGAALFSGGPLHDGLIGTSTTLAEQKLDAVRAFAARAFRPGNAILILTGNIDAGALSGVVTRAGPPGDMTPEPSASELPRTPPAARSVDANIAGTGLAWVGPPIADEASATSLDFLADYLFAPKTGAIAKALGTRKAVVTGKFVTYHNPGIFVVTISGDDAVAARPIVDRTIAAATTPLPAAAFSTARAAFVYHLLQQMDTPSELSDTYGWYAVEGDPLYAPAEGGMQGRYFRLVAGLTPAALARTATKFLGAAPAVVTLNHHETTQRSSGS